MEHFDIEPIVAQVKKEIELPLISSIGAGPRGKGVTARINEDDEGLFTFSIIDTETEQVLWTTPNLSPGSISVSNNNIIVTKGADVYEYPLDLPTPEDGSRIYVSNENFDKTNDGTYSINESELLIYGRSNWPSKPPCRVNDTIFFVTEDCNSVHYINFGTIEAVEPASGGDRLVVFTSRLELNAMVPYVNVYNGNWMVDEVDTGVHAQGPVGPQGPPGPAGRGVKYAVYNETTAAQIYEWMEDGDYVLLLVDSYDSWWVAPIDWYTDDAASFLYYNPSTNKFIGYSIDDNVGWHEDSWDVELSENKLGSGAAWVSNNTKYPTTQAVENRYQQKLTAGDGIEIVDNVISSSATDAGAKFFKCTHNSTTVQQIYSALGSNKIPYLITGRAVFFCQGPSQTNPLTFRFISFDDVDRGDYEYYEVTTDGTAAARTVWNHGYAILSDIEYVDYGVTNYNEIEALYSHGYTVILRINDDKVTYAPLTGYLEGEQFEFDMPSQSHTYRYYCKAVGGWSTVDYEHEAVSNKLKSVNQWTSNDQKYPTTAAVDGRFQQQLTAGENITIADNVISATGGSEMHVAVYGTTPFATIKGWYDAGDDVVVEYTDPRDGSKWIGQLDWIDTTTASFSHFAYDSGLACLKGYSVTGSTWNISTDYIEDPSNKLGSGAVWVGNNVKYPTTAAVDNRFQQKLTAGSGISIANNVISATGGGSTLEAKKLCTINVRRSSSGSWSTSLASFTPELGESYDDLYNSICTQLCSANDTFLKSALWYIEANVTFVDKDNVEHKSVTLCYDLGVFVEEPKGSPSPSEVSGRFRITGVVPYGSMSEAQRGLERTLGEIHVSFNVWYENLVGTGPCWMCNAISSRVYDDVRPINLGWETPEKLTYTGEDLYNFITPSMNSYGEHKASKLLYVNAGENQWTSSATWNPGDKIMSFYGPFQNDGLPSGMSGTTMIRRNTMWFTNAASSGYGGREVMNKWHGGCVEYGTSAMQVILNNSAWEMVPDQLTVVKTIGTDSDTMYLYTYDRHFPAGIGTMHVWSRYDETLGKIEEVYCCDKEYSRSITYKGVTYTLDSNHWGSRSYSVGGGGGEYNVTCGTTFDENLRTWHYRYTEGWEDGDCIELWMTWDSTHTSETTTGASFQKYIPFPYDVFNDPPISVNVNVWVDGATDATVGGVNIESDGTGFTVRLNNCGGSGRDYKLFISVFGQSWGVQ